MSMKFMMERNDSLLTPQTELPKVSQDSSWVCLETQREVTSVNISYLIKYERIPGIEKNGALMVSAADLGEYYFVSI